MATRTISNAGGNWGTAATWVEGAVPTAADDVVATATSGNLTMNVAGVCRSIDFTNYVATFTHAASQVLSIGTSSLGPGGVALKFVAGMTYTKSGAASSLISFVSTVTGNTITLAGKTIVGCTWDGVGGGWTLQDAFTATTGVTLTRGTLDTNNQTVVVQSFNSSGVQARTLTLGSSSFTCNGTGSAWNIGAIATAMTLNAGTSTINMTGASPTFSGGGLTYNNVVMSGSGAPTFSGTNTYANLTRTGTAVKTDELVITADLQTVTGTLTLTGNSTINRLFVRSDVLGTQRPIAAGSTVLTNVDFQDIAGQSAGAQVASVATGTAAGTPTSLVINKPAGTVSGDLLVASIAWYPGNYGGTPVGWTSIDALNLGGTPWGDGGAATYFRIAGGSEPANYTFVGGSNGFSVGSGAMGAIARITGHDSTSPINAHALGPLDSASPFSTPSVTTAIANALLLHTWGAMNSAGGVSYNDPSGVTLDAKVTSANNITFMIAHEKRASAGATTSRDATMTSAYPNLTAQVAIAPSAGSAWTGTSLGDAGGNSGITFPASVTRYWVGGSGNWSSTTKWSASSGGSSGASVPLPHDDVVIDSASSSAVNQTMTADMPRAGRNLTASAPSSGNYTVSGNIALTGNLNVGSLGTSLVTGGLTMWGRGAQTLRASTALGSGTMTIAAPGGTYTFTTAFSTGGAIQLLAGTLDVGTVDVTCASFDLNASGGLAGRTFNMNSRTLTVTGTGNVFSGSVTGTPGVLNAGTSKLVVSNTSASSKTINLVGAPGNTLYDVENINAGTGQINLQGGFFHDLKISGGTRVVQINSGGAIVVNGLFQAQSTTGAIITLSLADAITINGTWDVDGVAGARGVIQSANSSQQTINMPAGIIASDYLTISNTIATSPTYEGTMPSVRSWDVAQLVASRPFPLKIPADTVAGDLLIAIFSMGSSAAVNPATGWTERFDNAVPSSAGQARFVCYTKTATATDAGTTVTFAPAVAVNNDSYSYCFAVKNAYQSPAIALSIGSGSSSTGTSVSQASTIASFILDILFGHYPDNNATPLSVSMPAGGTQLFSENHGAGDAGGDHVIAAVARTQGAPGTPSTFTFARPDATAIWWAAAQFAVRPRIKVFAGANSLDSGGNAGWRFEDPDLSGPTLDITDPLNGAAVIGTINLSATATDPAGVVSVQWKLDGVNYGSPDVGASPYDTTLNTLVLTNGTHTISAVAVDGLGNTSTDSVTIDVVNDIVAPVVTITAPDSGDELAGVVTVSGTAVDPGGIDEIRLLIDGILIDTAASGASPWHFSSVSLAGLSAGPHTIRVEADDTFGNTGFDEVNIIITTGPAYRFMATA